MHHHILIPVALDHESVVPKKIEAARALLTEGGRMSLITVLENVPGYVAEFVAVEQENHLTQKVRDKLTRLADGDESISIDVLSGKPGLMVTDYARKNGVDLIIVGSHKPNVQDYFLGSTAARIARRAPCSVFVIR